jgi:hypothetical protein
MSLKERIALYKDLEVQRGRPLITYVTSTRQNSEAQIARDAICELLRQLQKIPDGTKELDL